MGTSQMVRRSAGRLWAASWILAFCGGLAGPAAAEAMPECVKSSFVLLRYGEDPPAKPGKANAMLYRRHEEDDAPQPDGMPISLVRAPAQGVKWFADAPAAGVAAELLLEKEAGRLGCDAGPKADKKETILREAISKRTLEVVVPGTAAEAPIALLQAYPKLPFHALVGPSPKVPRCEQDHVSPAASAAATAAPAHAPEEPAALGSSTVAVVAASLASLVIAALFGLFVLVARGWRRPRRDADEALAAVLSRLVNALERLPAAWTAPATASTGSGQAALLGAVAPAAKPSFPAPFSGKPPASTRPPLSKDEERRIRWAKHGEKYRGGRLAARLGSCQRAVSLFQDGNALDAVRDPWIRDVIREHERVRHYRQRYLEMIAEPAPVEAVEAELRELRDAIEEEARAGGVHLVVPELGRAVSGYGATLDTVPPKGPDYNVIRRLNEGTDNGTIVDIFELGWKGVPEQRATVISWSRQWAGMDPSGNQRRS